MTFFIAFLVLGILLGFYVLRLFTIDDKRKEDHKKNKWEKQSKEFMDMIKRKMK